MVSGDGMFYQIICFASVLAFLYVSVGDLWVWVNHHKAPELSFVKRDGTHFMVDDSVFYINGWNSYWLMDQAVDEHTRPRVRTMLQAGAKMGLTVCRTWAFNDGVYNALQLTPGQYDEDVFKALDHVIAEARQHGIRLLLSIVNNLQAFGGKAQYVKWAWEEGMGLSSSNDSFFYDPSIKQNFKNHVKTLLTRKNTITGIEYRDDPAIFAWELINEPRCLTDPSGDTLQNWIEEMSRYVKSIDGNHLLTLGHEGFYGQNSSKKWTINPGEWAANLGSDFIRNSNTSDIDFASVHIYPDQWFPKQELGWKLKFVSNWTASHIEDGEKELKKPVAFTEFGLSNLNKGFEASQREMLNKIIYDIMYKSAKKKRSGAGSFVWQYLVEGMEEYNDDFGIVPWERPSMYQLITKHSCRLAAVQRVLPSQKNHLKEMCKRS